MLQNNKPQIRTNISPYKCKIHFFAQNTAEIPLKNHSILQGAIYNLFAQIDPKFSYQQHKSTLVKAWSFSLLKFTDEPEKGNRKGHYKITQGARGYFFFKTIDPVVYIIFMKFSLKKRLLRIGKLILCIETVDSYLGDYNKVPNYLDQITIRLETPTFFYNNRTKKMEILNGETFLKYQCEKFKQLGIMDIEPEQLYPYMWIIYNDTHDSTGYYTNRNDNTSVLPFKGIIGTVTFKIVGNAFERGLMWKIIYLSEYTGIGTRTSLGFGHSTMISVR